MDEVIATLAEETSVYAKVEIFLSHWTLKEAYVNVIGKELLKHLKVFSFDPASKAIAPDNTLGDNSRCW
ncbi:MAG: 4'-phosphopantetheinyl transferase superfamily protein [Tateyamaria sp.]|nr:4'-phosphopantetheinyl transferase superfamily protein [Tateyamaria sp.]MBT5303311.1 4'-phosphopantetheinyl transferase superfamily protein [Tateyamaria sp.]MBT6343547.1 4'-phosphopantetheinyl transferase superfamily protein [Tateyamaria sp.]MBT7449130.1 4'-phosphopantetheinyl transferase superfamily protein [Tateyamaria sp.]MBT7800755.1 4'-phosphopantetheinyl transferase superfamily protein [Tateyamaria sp.]